MRRLLFFLMFISIVQITYSHDTTPYCKVESNDKEIVVSYSFNGATIQKDPLYHDAFFYKVKGFGLNDVPGEPAIPFRMDCISLPKGCSYEISVIEAVYSDTTLTLAPSRPPLAESDTIGYSELNVPEICHYGSLFPANLTEVVDKQAYGGYDILRIRLYPIQYNHSSRIVRRYSKITYKVTYKEDHERKIDERIYTNASVSRFINNLSLNGISTSQESSKTSNSISTDNRYYLIVTTNEFLPAVNKFAEWKRIKGNRVVIE